MEPTSEQELKQLLDEGRITEEEYKELLEAIRQKETVQKPVDVPQQPTDPKPRTGYGKAALILMIAGVLMPIAALAAHFVIMYAGVRLGMFLFLPFLLLGIFCLFLAFIFGIIGWKTAGGKIAAIGVPCLGLLIVPGLLLLSLFSVRASHQVAIEDQFGTENLVTHKNYPMDTLEGLISQDMAVIDEDVFVNGGGSLRIVSDSPEKRTVRLYESAPWDIEGGLLTYQAKMKSLNLKGRAYLEMWCEIPGKGEFFSRGLEQPISGTTDWTMTKIPFRLEPGQKPSNIKLNLVTEGTGTIWIDDIVLSSSPLN
ncbi:MAG: hypothetical protein ACYTEN_07010 [Planctomycetota bacterium]|jgi:hypothetical protein